MYFLSYLKMIVLSLKINPNDHEQLPNWNNDLIWKSFENKDALTNYIKTIQQAHIKSGTVMYHNNETNTFQSISFRSKKINEPKNENVIIKVRQNRKSNSLAFEDKLDILNDYVKEHGQPPDADAVVDDFHVGTFYQSLIKNRDRYQNLLSNLGKDDDEQGEEQAEEQAEESVEESQAEPTPAPEPAPAPEPVPEPVKPAETKPKGAPRKGKTGK